MSQLPFVSMLPFVITLCPTGPVQPSFPSLDQALETARSLDASGHTIVSIGNEDNFWEGAELRAALGESKRPRRSTFYVET